MEFGIPISLDTPAGTITFNAYASADYYRVTDFQLGKPLRITVDPAPQADGAIVGPGFRGGAYPILEGQIIAASNGSRSTQLDKIRSWPDSIRSADGTLRWTPSGKTERRMLVRLLEDVPTKGGVIKEFHLALVAADPVTYENVLNSVDSSALTSGGGGSFVIPFTIPFSFGQSSTGGVATATNGGEVAVYPTVRLYGPISAPIVKNNTSGELVSLPGLAIAGTDFIEIDMRRRSVLLNGSSQNSLIGKVDVASSIFFRLAKGANQLQLSGAGFDANTKLTVLWRNGFM